MKLRLRYKAFEGGINGNVFCKYRDKKLLLILGRDLGTFPYYDLQKLWLIPSYEIGLPVTIS
jgi:hypothetical protein